MSKRNKTTPKKSARVRRPHPTFDGRIYISTVHPKLIMICGQYASLKSAKKLHTWLGKAIKYLEGKK